MALGNAWFVKNVKIVENADAEMEAIGTINPRFDVVVQKKYENRPNIRDKLDDQYEAKVVAPEKFYEKHVLPHADCTPSAMGS